MPTQPALTQPTQRDLRIDFFKGVALLIVLIDHIEGWAQRSVIETWTLINLGFSDAAEIFIFLSGYVFAVAYSRVLDREGFGRCLLKALKRSAQIYVAYLLAAVTVIAIGASALSWLPPPFEDRFLIGEHAVSSLIASLLLCFHPWGFDILAMYVPVLPLMAVLLYLLRGDRFNVLLAWCISAGLYLLVQINPAINLPRFGDGGVWYFNPLAWQFLFFLGLVVGNPVIGKPARETRSLAPRWLLVTLSVAMLACGLIVLKGFEYLMRFNVRTWEDLEPMIAFYRAWAVKTELGPLRLLHFFALAYLTSLVLPPSLSVWSRRWARPLIVAGQHSLEVYAFGLVLSFLGAFVLLRGPLTSSWGVILVDLAACAASLGFGYVVAWWKTGRRQPQDGQAKVIPRGSHGKSIARHPNRPALVKGNGGSRRRKSGKPRSGA
jgi:hypothetical protein